MFLLLLFLTLTTATDKCPPDPVKDAVAQPATCGGTWTREQLMECFDHIIDTNCDHVIQPHEVDEARQNHLKWWERGLAWLSVSTERIFCSCDTDQDGKITQEEFRANYKVCMENESHMCRLKRICDREMPITPKPQCK
jgi:hypothetical protein